MAYTLANGLAYVDELIGRGGDVAKFAKRLSFFFYVHMDFFEEVCKFRAGRRLWARLLRERYGVTDDKALMFRFGVVCGGSSLTARAALQQRHAGRDRDHGRCAWAARSRSSPPRSTRRSRSRPNSRAELALRTQQIVAYESGIAEHRRPAGRQPSGRVPHRPDGTGDERVMAEIDAYGGVVKAIEEGWLQATHRRAGARAQARHRRRTHRRGRGERILPRRRVAQTRGRCPGSIRRPAQDTVEKFEALRAAARQRTVERTLARLSEAAANDRRKPAALPGRLLPRVCHRRRDGRAAEEANGAISRSRFGYDDSECRDRLAARAQGQADPRCQAGTGRPRHRRQGHRARAARRWGRGDLYRPAQDARLHRPGRGRGGRRRGGPERALGQPSRTGGPDGAAASDSSMPAIFPSLSAARSRCRISRNCSPLASGGSSPPRWRLPTSLPPSPRCSHERAACRHSRPGSRPHAGRAVLRAAAGRPWRRCRQDRTPRRRYRPSCQSALHRAAQHLFRQPEPGQAKRDHRPRLVRGSTPVGGSCPNRARTGDQFEARGDTQAPPDLRRVARGQSEAGLRGADRLRSRQPLRRSPRL